MKLRMHTLSVLMRKDCKMLMTNKNVIIMMLLPIVFCVLYQALFVDMVSVEDGTNGFIIDMCAILNLCAVSLNGLAMMVAEEKEKNTLRVLMLHDVSAVEYIVSKLIVMLVSSEIVALAIYFITGSPLEGLVAYLLVTAIAAFSLLLFGAVIGLCSKDQMATGTIAAPLMLLFMLPPMFGELNSFFQIVADLIPTTALMNMIDAIILNQSILTGEFIKGYAMLVAWIVIGLAVFAFVYKKKMKDN